MHIPINLVFEDAISEFIMLKILNSFDKKFSPAFSYLGNGFGYIKSNIKGFNQAAIATPFFILADLDNYTCPSSLINDWLKLPPKPNLIFRVAVKEVETWLLADIEGFSKFIGVAEVNFPDNPELEQDPKQTLIRLVRRSRKRNIKEDIIPKNDKAKIGPNYNERLIEYVSDFWDLNRALKRANSLQRTYNCLSKFTWVVE